MRNWEPGTKVVFILFDQEAVGSYMKPKDCWYGVYETQQAAERAREEWKAQGHHGLSIVDTFHVLNSVSQ